MRVLVLGGGLMGRAAADDLSRQPDVDRVTIADVELSRAEEAARKTGRDYVTAMRLDVADHDAVLAAMREADSVLGAVSYKVNLGLSKLAIEAGAHWCDMGGNNDVVAAQLELNAQAKEAGVSVIPDTGLAPGMVSLLTMHGIAQMDRADAAHLRVGGLPVEPTPPLNYRIVFSIQGLINEYVEPCVAIRDGRVVDNVEPLADVEQIAFPLPFGELEAFNTSGGTSTLPQTLAGRIANLDYKTIRYPGHASQMRAMLELGLMSDEPIDVDDTSVAPRAVLERLIAKNVPLADDDVVLVRVTVEGEKDGKPARAIYEMVDHRDEETGLTAMMRGTAFPSATVCVMMGRGETPAGATPQELAVDPQRFIEELRARGLPLEARLEVA